MSKTVKLEDVIAMYKSFGDEHQKFIDAIQSLPQESKEQWTSVDTPPKNENWHIVKVDHKHHILPHSYVDGDWWCYGSSIPNESNVTHYKPFTD